MKIGGCHLGLDFHFLFPMSLSHQAFCGYSIVLMLDWKSACYSNQYEAGGND